MSSQAFRLGGRPIPLLKGALGAAVALAALGLSPGEAQAACAPGTAATLCRVTVGGLQYDVTTFTGSYNGNPSNFETPANNGVMPWWTGGSNATATAFVTEVGGYFGTGLNASMATYGPIFAYSVRDSNFLNSAWRYDNGTIVDDAASKSVTFVYAQATLYTAPAAAAAAAAPGPLPLFGAAAAFGFSRRLRKRTQGTRLLAVSNQPRA